MVVTTIRDKFQRATNPYREAIDNLLYNLPKDERRQIANELKRNKKIIEKYYGPIKDPTDIKKRVVSLSRFAY